MSTTDVTYEEWSRLDLQAAESIASAVARAVGGEVEKVHIRTYAERTAPNAVIIIGGEQFAFVPGGDVVLGFDPAGWEPTEDELLSQLGSYTALDPFPQFADLEQDDRDEFRANATEAATQAMREAMAAITSRPRTTSIRPFLAAVQAHEAGISEAQYDHPVIVELIQKWKPGIQAFVGDMIVQDTDAATHGRVRFDDVGRPTSAQLAAHTTYSAITTELTQKGRRLPTPDEWEHAYAFGCRSLFPWGDRMPTQWNDDGTLVLPDGVQFQASGPMLSGLFMALNPYKWELTNDRSQVRGADGGDSECGGYPWFDKWMVQASAYQDPEHGSFVADRPHTRGTVIRPVIPL